MKTLHNTPGAITPDHSPAQKAAIVHMKELRAHAQGLAKELERCRDLVIAYRKAYCASFSDDADVAIKSAYQILQDGKQRGLWQRRHRLNIVERETLVELNKKYGGTKTAIDDWEKTQ